MTERAEAGQSAPGEMKPFWSQECGKSYKSPYKLWKGLEGLPTVRGHILENLYTQELTPWPSRGGSGVFINGKAARSTRSLRLS